jgi:predicted ATPase/DNA-binding winged helix-turn-helix (wHTH) protein
MRRAASSHKTLTFGPYRLVPAQRLLMRGDAPAPIGSRALDLLVAFVEHAGKLLSKEQLLAVAWPTTTVHEANLRVHIAGIRKLLGDGQAGARYIVSEAGRGYCFVAPVTVSDQAAPAADSHALARDDAGGESENFGTRLAQIIGRSKIVDTIGDLLPKRRFVTLVGPGGIGKTTVALAVEEGLRRSCETRFVDLSPLADPTLAASKLAAAIGLAVRLEDQVPDLVRFLRDKRMLIVVDTCEHVIDAATSLIEGLLGGAPQLMILATSREPLRAKGEWVQRLTPLTSPDPTRRLSAAEALSFPAVQLFVERAAASLDGFELTDANAPIIAGVCRKLDGLPLAIELAAARIDAFGLRGPVELLDRRFQLPTSGRRAAPARHRTLNAMLDWSYLTLPETERAILRRLSVFAGPFTLDAAGLVASDSALTASVVVECVANLVEKSLVAADLGGDEPRYRLLDTTRAYALKKLEKANELASLARRHAEYYKDAFEQSAVELEQRPKEWLAAQRREIDNVRAALDWAFSPSGDMVVGVALTLAAIPLWIHLSLNEECCARVETALARLDPDDPTETRTLVRLAMLAGGSPFKAERAIPEAAAWSNTLAIAERLGDVEFQLRALYGWWNESVTKSDLRMSSDFSRRFAALAPRSSFASDVMVGERLLGATQHYMGNQAEARRLTEHVLRRYVPDPSHITRFQLDQRLMARCVLPFILWLQGFPDQTMRMGDANAAERENTHVMSFLFNLCRSTCPIAFLTGDLAAADRFLDVLREHCALHKIAIWDKWMRCFEAVRLIESGDLSAGASRLAAELDPVPTGIMHVHYCPFLCDVATAALRLGKIDQALTTIQTALDLAHVEGALWIVPEALRIRGEIARARGDADQAETDFKDSLDLAHRQKALSWELRAATGFARLRQQQGRPKDALDLLAPVYDRFTEGFQTRDLTAARGLLEELAGDAPRTPPPSEPGPRRGRPSNLPNRKP